jgi:hypothetical protein
MIYEREEPQWNDINKGNPDSSIIAFWQSYQESYLVTKYEELEKEMMNFALRSICLFHTSKGFLMCRKILIHLADDFTSPPNEAVLRISIALRSTSRSARLETANLGCHDNHANRYATEDDKTLSYLFT